MKRPNLFGALLAKVYKTSIELHPLKSLINIYMNVTSVSLDDVSLTSGSTREQNTTHTHIDETDLGSLTNDPLLSMQSSPTTHRPAP